MAKKTKDTTKKNRVAVMLDDELKKDLNVIADKLHTPVSTLVRMWVAEKVESMKPKTRKK